MILSNMLYKRGIKEVVLRQAQHFPAVVVTGARQSGKTTLLREAFSDYNYVSLDLPSEAERAEKDSQAFLSANPPPLIIDEVQYAPEIFRHLKVQIDNDRNRYGTFILSGSQKFPLMKEVSDSLAGRAGLVELETLSAAEILAGPKRAPALTTTAALVSRGGFPELWKQPTLQSSDFFRAYLATYIERDVRQILNVSSLRDFERFIRLCAARNGQLLNKTSLASGVGVSLKTITDWLSVLEASNQIALLEPFMANLGKRIVKSPKLYFCDTGLLCFLLGVDAKEIATSPFRGPVWETFLYAELRKYLALTEPSATLWFYRDQQGREVDFVLQRGSRITLVEGKWTARVNLDDGKWMHQVATFIRQRAAPLEVDAMLLACGTDQPYPVSADRSQYAINGARLASHLASHGSPRSD